MAQAHQSSVRALPLPRSHAGCRRHPRIPPSAECRDAMQTAAAEEDMEKGSPLISASLSACESGEEWLAALEEYPAAMGHAEGAEVGDIDLRAACGHARGTPVCEDAVEDGRLTRAQVQY